MTASYPDSVQAVNNVTLRIDADWSSLSASCVSFCRWLYRWHRDTGDVSPSTAYFAYKQGKHKSTVYRWLSALEAAGAIRRDEAGTHDRKIVPLAVPPPAGKKHKNATHNATHNATRLSYIDADTQNATTMQCVESSIGDIGGLGLPQSQSAGESPDKNTAPATECLESSAENPLRPIQEKTGGALPLEAGETACASGGVGGPAKQVLEQENREVSSGQVACDVRKTRRKQGCLDGSKRSVKNLETPVPIECLPQSTAPPVRTGSGGSREKAGSIPADLPIAARALASSLRDVGVAEPVAYELATKKPAETAEQLAALPYRSARDAAAVLVASVRQSWPIPAAFLAAMAREKKQQAEAQNRALRAELSKKRETSRQDVKTAFYGLPDAVRADLLARADADLRANKRIAWDFMQKRPPEVRASWVADRAISLMG